MAQTERTFGRRTFLNRAGRGFVASPLILLGCSEKQTTTGFDSETQTILSRILGKTSQELVSELGPTFLLPIQTFTEGNTIAVSDLDPNYQTTLKGIGVESITLSTENQNDLNLKIDFDGTKLGKGYDISLVNGTPIPSIDMFWINLANGGQVAGFQTTADFNLSFNPATKDLAHLVLKYKGPFPPNANHVFILNAGLVQVSGVENHLFTFPFQIHLQKDPKAPRKV